MINLKDIDLKIIGYLYNHNREPFTKIAKSLKLTRQQVEYSISKLEQEGIIQGYFPVINYSKLSYNLFTIILLKFSNSSQIKSFKEKYKNDSHRILHGELLSQYDLFMTLIFKDEKERNEYLLNLFQNNQISSHLIIEPYYNEMYPLKFIGNNTQNSFVMIDYNKEEIKLDERDKKILKILSINARTKLIDIASKSKTSIESVLYKIKRMEKERLILGSRAYFDMDKIGYFYTLLLINMTQMSKSNQEKIKNFAKTNPNIDSISLMANTPNCYIQVFNKSESELREVLKSLKEHFKEELFSVNILPLKNEGENLNPLPFLS
ncbi:MAG: winged helix-turn-helix transcriptional regulator [Nanoarchaeota archaeon]